LSSVGIQRADTATADRFTALVDQHRARLRHHCLRLCHFHESDADDLLQDTFARAFVRFDTLEDEARFAPWCRTIARNIHLDDIRRRPAVEEPLSVNPVDPHDQMGEVADQLALRAALVSALSAMPERSQRVVTERAEGRSAKAIAGDLKVSPASVDTIYARARARLRATPSLWDALLGVGAVVPIRVRAWAHRRSRAVAEFVRRADMTGLSQLAAVVVAAVLISAGVVVAVSGSATSAGSAVAATHGATRSLSPAVNDPAGQRLLGAPLGGSGSSTGRQARHFWRLPPFEPRHCLLVAQCGANANPSRGDIVIPVFVGPFGTNLYVNPHGIPGELALVPRGPADLEVLVFGQPGAIACDLPAVTGSRSCTGRTLLEVVYDTVDVQRQALFGDLCPSTGPVPGPLVCRSVPPLSTNAAGGRVR
jgi:RNA polymerase sigma factor (sigma-70 family)